MTVKPEKLEKLERSAWIILLLTVLSEIDFMYSTKESKNKGAKRIFCNGKFSEDEQGEIWIKCFIWTLPEQRATFINRLEVEMDFA